MMNKIKYVSFKAEYSYVYNYQTLYENVKTLSFDDAGCASSL